MTAAQLRVVSDSKQEQEYALVKNPVMNQALNTGDVFEHAQVSKVSVLPNIVHEYDIEHILLYASFKILLQGIQCYTEDNAERYNRWPSSHRVAHEPCMFPFQYEDNSGEITFHTTCTWKDSEKSWRNNKPWCPTRVRDKAGNYMDPLRSGPPKEGACGSGCTIPAGNHHHLPCVIM